MHYRRLIPVNPPAAYLVPSPSLVPTANTGRHVLVIVPGTQHCQATSQSQPGLPKRYWFAAQPKSWLLPLLLIN